jgi:hypothetical protein
MSRDNNSFGGQFASHIQAAAAAMTVLALLAPGPSHSAEPIMIVKGECFEDSRIAEGPVDVDLEPYRSAYYCNQMIITEPAPGRRLVQFIDQGAFRDTLVGFAVEKTAEPGVWNVTRIYLRPGKETPVDNGMCIFNYKSGRLEAVVCGARAEADRRAAAVSVGFKAE